MTELTYKFETPDDMLAFMENDALLDDILETMLLEVVEKSQEYKGNASSALYTWWARVGDNYTTPVEFVMFGKWIKARKSLKDFEFTLSYRTWVLSSYDPKVKALKRPKLIKEITPEDASDHFDEYRQFIQDVFAIAYITICAQFAHVLMRPYIQRFYDEGMVNNPFQLGSEFSQGEIDALLEIEELVPVAGGYVFSERSAETLRKYPPK